jgi:signal transduction histidine kinase/ligand-binding sensor domain-containing protein/AraC-like DNA-binding protein
MNRMNKMIFLLIINTLFISLSIFAQEPHTAFKRFTAESGLAVPMVKGLVQDKEGYIWVGTVNAIQRFDGFAFKTIKYESGRKTNMTKGPVNVIYEDKKGDLWIGTPSGLSRFNKMTEEFQQYIPDPLGPVFKNDMWSVFEDSKDLLWVGASMGLYFLDKSSDKLVPFIFPENNDLLTNVSFRSVVEDKQGYIWFGTGVGLLKYNRNTNSMNPVWIDPNPPALLSKTWNTGEFAVQTIYQDNSGILWIGSFGGTILKLDPADGKIEYFVLEDKKTLERFPIQSICEEDEYSLWVGTYNGLLLFEKTSGKILQHHVYDEGNDQSLNDNKVTRVLKDKSGSLWVGTLMGGLNKLNKTKFSFKTIVRKKWGAEKTYFQVLFPDMVVSRTGSLLAGTMYGIEEIIPEENLISVHPPFKAINTLIEDSRGNLWIAIRQISGGGFYMKDPKGNLYPVVDSTGNIFSREIQCIYESKNGKIFIGSEFYIFEINKETHTASLLHRNTTRIYNIGEDVNDVLCFGTMAGGLIFYDADSKAVIKHFMPDEKDPFSIGDNTVTNIYLDSRERLWVATTLGLNKYDRENGKFICYNKEKGLAENIILKIIEDNSGNLWLGSASGISKFNPETETIKNYDASYGLVHTQYYATGKSESGELFFKGRIGITHFHPEKIKDNPFIPPVVITELKVLNESCNFQDVVELSFDRNYISFEFAALSYISPEKNQYAYKMENVDRDWVYPGSRRYAAYTDLQPGKYVFRVKASNNDGVWNNEGASLSIIINPPWYKTYWAYTGYFMVFLLVAFSWRKYDLKRQDLKYQLKLEHTNSEKQEEISRLKFRFFTNISHEFRTPLTLIIGPTEKIIESTDIQDNRKQAAIIKKNALRLIGLINQLLDISKLDEGKLKLQVSKRNLVSFIRGVVMNFESYAEERDITLKVNSEKETIEGYFDKEKTERIIINLLSNAFKFTPDGGKIEVSFLESSGSGAVIKIKDSGIGIPEQELPNLFKRFYQIDDSPTRMHEGTGIGLALTRELVELHKGKISIKSKEGEWTEVTIELPLSRDIYEDDEVMEAIHSETDQPSEQYYHELFGPQSEIKSGFSKSDLSLEKTDEERLIILVVEDNADVREYIKDSIGAGFQVEEAANGEQGMRKAFELIPDLIISDIMMPKMDGYQFTRIMKSDKRTNHIPVIVLTAKSTPGDKLEGLETGADDYLVKPFDMNELKVRIYNLINIRKILQEKFSGLGRSKEISEIKNLSDVNSEFIRKVIEVISNHMAEEEFTIEDFGNELGMGRSQLHRKLKAITGKSASRYLRTYRLNTAKEMIENHKGNISEIAYSVGFSSPIYFSKCFRDEFGIAPSELKTHPAAGE